MTERVLGPTGGRRRKRLALLVPMFAIAALILAIGAYGGASSDSGFEGNDANLAPGDGGLNFDWNSFASVSWSGGGAPYRTATRTVSGWKFVGIEDAQEDSSDTVFGGGTKQDKECPDVNEGPKAPNKDDLKRIYLASKIVNDEVFLALAWARIPQNSTSASAHVGFEFNQGDTSCGAGSDDLVERTADDPATLTDNEGDMLIVYDFEGGSAPAILKLLRWQTTGTCEQTNKPATSAGCWVFQQTLTATGNAEARVNTDDAQDDLAPPLGSVPPDTLHTQEFGEAIVNLSDAGVFPSVGCRTFGNVYAVSRSSGNSGQAQMKDLVGPGDSGLSNCGSIKIIKETIPAGLSANFPFSSNIETNSAGSGFSCTPDTTPNSFTLNDGASSTDHETCSDVKAGSYAVEEGTPPSGFSFDSVSCTGTGGSSGSQDGSNAKVNITLTGNGSVECTFKNKRDTGALRILKKSTKTGNPLVQNAGAVFSYTGGGSVTDNGSGDESSTVGEICVSGLNTGTYTVNETSPPSGYAGASQTNVSAAVVAGTNCTDNKPTNANSASFTNDPLADIQVRFRDGGSTETSLSEALSCNNASGTSSTSATTGWDDTLTVSGVRVGATVVTITCTIKIDP